MMESNKEIATAVSFSSSSLSLSSSFFIILSLYSFYFIGTDIYARKVQFITLEISSFRLRLSDIAQPKPNYPSAKFSQIDLRNKQITSWKVLCTIFIRSLMRIRKLFSFTALTRSFADTSHLVDKRRTRALSISLSSSSSSSS